MTNYRSINDAAHWKALARGDTKIWYMRSEFFRDFIFGLDALKRRPELVPTHSSIAKTHVVLGEVASDSPEELFATLQADAWSPNGEAAELVESLGLSHTSMSVGDVVQVGQKLYFCDNNGFVDLSQVKE